jgi:excisionase family DNA binding protein
MSRVNEKDTAARRVEEAPAATNRRLLDPPRAAEYLACSVRTFQELVWNGSIPRVRIGNLMRVDVRDLDRFIEERKFVECTPE